MMVLITYDVSLEDSSGQGRLRRIAKLCLDYGIRVQYSVFECELTPAQWVVLRGKLLSAYNEKIDSLRFYKLGAAWRDKVEHCGAKKPVDLFQDTLII